MYTSNDSNRMYLAYFILSACDLLDIITTSTTPAERQDWIDWIYHCQHPNGGFRMWPGTDFGERATTENAKWDPANINATYFALTSLLILGDDLQRVNRKHTLRWVNDMQRDDGSFGETLVDGKQEGGRDPRLGYCATGVRYILRGATAPGTLNIGGERVDDIDFDKYIECIRCSESFDGGIADAPFHEPQAGYTFCSLGSLAFLSRLESGDVARARPGHGPSSPPDVVRWLLSLQTTFIDPETPPTTDLSIPLPAPIDLSDDDEEVDNKPAPTSKPQQQPQKEPEPQNPATTLHQSPDKSTMWAPGTTLDTTLLTSTQTPTPHSGICGRPSKPADTCYAFWAGASLSLLSASHLSSTPALRHYLLALTQHPIMGGFSKFPGDKWADLYHSYLGLAALSLVSTEAERESDGVKGLDAGMCVSGDVRGRLECGVWEGFREV
ncbi:hypothetical protein MBLNU13_g04622t1 [Cladosporium sp. NU13]